jgi:hypothetical protein
LIEAGKIRKIWILRLPNGFHAETRRGNYIRWRVAFKAVVSLELLSPQRFLPSAGADEPFVIKIPRRDAEGKVGAFGVYLLAWLLFLTFRARRGSAFGRDEAWFFVVLLFSVVGNLISRRGADLTGSKSFGCW